MISVAEIYTTGYVTLRSLCAIMKQSAPKCPISVAAISLPDVGNGLTQLVILKYKAEHNIFGPVI